MSSYDRRTMFRFLFLFYFLCEALPGTLSQSLKDEDEIPNANTDGKRTARCSWKCHVMPDSESEMKGHINMGRTVAIELTLRQKVDDKCLNRDSQSSSRPGNAWQCSKANTLTHERNVYNPPDGSGSDSSSSRTVVEQMKGTVECTFGLTKDAATQQLNTSIGDLISNALIEKVEELTEAWQCGGEIEQCCRELEQNSFCVCRTSYRKLECPVSTSSDFTISTFLILLIFLLYSPAFPLTQNIDLIVFDGPRGWVANFMFYITLYLILSFAFNGYLGKPTIELGTVSSKLMITVVL